MMARNLLSSPNVSRVQLKNLDLLVSFPSALSFEVFSAAHLHIQSLDCVANTACTHMHHRHTHTTCVWCACMHACAACVQCVCVVHVGCMCVVHVCVCGVCGCMCVIHAPTRRRTHHTHAPLTHAQHTHAPTHTTHAPYTHTHVLPIRPPYRCTIGMTAVRFWTSICMYNMCNSSAYCIGAQHGWLQRWLIVKGISVKVDKIGKESRESASEGILKKVKGDDAECRLAKQRQRMANHRAHER